MSDRYEEVKTFMAETFEEQNWENTPENRLEFLYCVQKAWNEDPDIQLEKTLYKAALMSLIFKTEMEVRFPNLR